MSSPRILAACLGKCVHTAGILNFLRLAESLGYETEFMGPAVPVKKFVAHLSSVKAELAAVSYRMTPEVAAQIFQELQAELQRLNLSDTRIVLGTTPAVAKIAAQTPIFEAIFTGSESRREIIDYLKQQKTQPLAKEFSQSLLERIKKQAPLPLLRHHLGLKTLEETIKAAREIALSQELDILSIAPDQNAQEYFFRPEEMPSKGSGAGGVPLRQPEDLAAIYAASRCGNYPLVRCYAGTRDLIKWARMCKEKINIAWGAVPLFWYSELDKRSPRRLQEAISENQDCIKWYAQHNLPLEVNDSHQWSLREAPDAVAVAAAFLSAYNAKKLGVKHYIAQYMLNTPPETSPAMDLAKMLAKIEMIEGLADSCFQCLRQIRSGLASMPVESSAAKGHLAASISVGMMLRPHIVHVVGFCEADHAAGAEEIIESCKLARSAIRLALKGLPDISADKAVCRRKKQLIKEARVILKTISALGKSSLDAWTDAAVLEKAVTSGILDAPQLCGSLPTTGTIVTAPVEGGYVSLDPKSGTPISEQQRLKNIRRRNE